MQYKNIYVLKRVWILFFFFYSTHLWAQPFSGGSNSGSFASNSVAINCTLDRYFGGDNEGSSSAKTTIFDCTPTRYFGNIMAGSSSVKTTVYNCSMGRFLGDSSDGSSTVKTTVFNCTPFRFSGDSADGSSFSKTNNFICTPTRFWGNEGDGAAASKFLLIRNFLGNDTSVIIVCSNNTFNLLGLYNAAGLTYNWNAPAPATVGLGNYQLIATNSSGCVDTAMALVKQEIAKWNGSVSNNWHTAANWDSGKIPNEKTHVIIPGGTANPCQIMDTDATAASVQAKSSGSFSIINNRILVITANCVSLPPG